jgi:glutamate-1-semialdehyde 2,1-aminomutase
MRPGGYVDDMDRVFLSRRQRRAEPWALPAMLAVIDTYQQEGIAEQLHQIGAELRGIRTVLRGRPVRPALRPRG